MGKKDNDKGDLAIGLISFILPFGLVVLSYFLFHEFKIVDYILLAIGGIDLLLFLSNISNKRNEKKDPPKTTKRSSKNRNTNSLYKSSRNTKNIYKKR